MIISHEHRFIFVKTAKTGGTSIEVALRTLCGDKDVITPLTEDEAGLPGRGPQNFLFPMIEWSEDDRVAWMRGERPNLHQAHSLGFHSHSKAAALWARLDRKIWSSYFKFSIERNPWDRQVSYYHWRLVGLDTPEAFAAFTRDNYVDNWTFYTIGDQIAVDHVIRYGDDLHEGLNEALSHIGLSAPPLTREKGGKRPISRYYRDYYDKPLQNLVATRHKREIAHFGWTF